MLSSLTWNLQIQFGFEHGSGRGKRRRIGRTRGDGVNGEEWGRERTWGRWGDIEVASEVLRWRGLLEGTETMFRWRRILEGIGAMLKWMGGVVEADR